ncbi:MAG: hypothetical protein GXO48_06770 [Chlorobi bacterium]|nr:hypothetical protein [Chlorobiota bacterium]
MLATKVKRYVEEMLEGKLMEMDAFLVDIEYMPESSALFVAIDTDPGVTVDQCADVARFLRDKLSDSPIGEYIQHIQVSSPGLDRPFKVLRQYQKNVGREVRVELVDHTVKEGVLLYADAEKIVLGIESTDKRIGEMEQTEIPFVKIKQTRLILRF